MYGYRLREEVKTTAPNRDSILGDGSPCSLQPPGGGGERDYNHACHPRRWRGASSLLAATYVDREGGGLLPADTYVNGGGVPCCQQAPMYN